MSPYKHVTGTYDKSTDNDDEYDDEWLPTSVFRQFKSMQFDSFEDFGMLSDFSAFCRYKWQQNFLCLSMTTLYTAIDSGHKK